MPYRIWNFLIAAQSAADCSPSTVSVPKPPSRVRYVSTARWCSPCGHPADALGFGLGFVVFVASGELEGFGEAVRLGCADGDVTGCSGVGDALAPDAPSVSPTGPGVLPPAPSACGSSAQAPTPTSTTTARAVTRARNRTRCMGPPWTVVPLASRVGRV